MGTFETNQADFFFECQALEAEKLQVLDFVGHEELSRPFRFVINLVARSPDVDLEVAIGKPACLQIRGFLPAGSRYTRLVHGIIERFEQHSAGKRQSTYQAILVPTISPLGYTNGARIFQETTTPDILKKVLSPVLSGDHLKTSLRASYKNRNFCVQYQESDFAFFSRLAEHEGIFYYFDHTESGAKLVLVDNQQSVDSLPHFEELSHFDQLNVYQEGIQAFRSAAVMRTGRVAMKDYRMHNPRLDLLEEKQGGAFADLEAFHFPGQYGDEGLAKRLTQVRLEEYQHDRKQFQGLSNCRALRPGYKFKLTGHRRESCRTEYLIVHVEHRGTQQQILEGTAKELSPEQRYASTLRCIPMNVQFRPPRLTHRPTIPGVQSAMVVGPPGEEIHCDAHGRVKVQFHWDRQGQRDDSSSCWIRVSQPWGGAGQGGMFIPRIGQEVLVQFLEGDPDRPIIVGRVYNGENAVPHGLPAAKNISTIRSASTPGGGGFNEIRFDDSAGSEEVFFHAQKDHNHKVGNNHGVKVGNNQKVEVKQNHKMEVGANHDTEVGASSSLTVTDKHKVKVGSDHKTEVGGNQDTSVTGNRTVTVTVNQATTVTGNNTVKVSANQSLTVTGNNSTKVTGNHDSTITGNHSEEVQGDSSETNKGGWVKDVLGKLHIKAPDWLEEKVSAMEIIDASSIEIITSQLAIKGLSEELVGISLEITGIKGENEPMKLEDAVLKLQDAVTKIGNNAMELADRGLELANSGLFLGMSGLFSFL